MSSERPIFLADGNETTFEASRVVVLPVPFEGTVSYGGGTADGPRAILAASTQVESYDEGLDGVPSECGIWTEPPLAIPEGPTEHVVGRIAERFGELIDAGKWVVMLGGEHSITPGGVAAVARRYPGLHVVQLDAHADLRESYQGDRFSHASAMAR